MNKNNKEKEYYISRIEAITESDPYNASTGGLTTTYFSLDLEDGEISITQEYDNNSTPEPVWNGRVIMRRIGYEGNCFNEDELRSTLENNEELIEKILEGSEVLWNGSNHVGSYGIDVEEALEKLIEELEYCVSDEIEVWHVEPYLYELVTPEMTEEEIDTLCKNIENDKNVIIIGDVREYLEEEVKRQREILSDVD